MKTRFLALLTLPFLAFGPSLKADDVAVFDIRMGKEPQLQRVVIEFYDKEAPGTVANFKKLVTKKFYNGIAFHRVFPNQLVQAGDPQSKNKKDRRNIGTGGPGYTLPPELSKRKHQPGTVSMARLGDKLNPAKVSNGSQFFVSLAPMPNYDGQYTIFGRVAEGLDAVNAMSAKPSDSNDNPIERIVIERAQILPREAVGPAPAPKKGIKKFFRL